MKIGVAALTLRDNPFHAIILFQCTLETSKNLKFLMFPGVIERDKRHEMGKQSSLGEMII